MVMKTTKLQTPTKFVINNGTKNLEYEIALNTKGVRQWRKSKRAIQEAPPILIKHWDSLHGGMGYSRDETRDAPYAAPVYESGPGVTCRRGYLYPALAVNTVTFTTPTGSVISVDRAAGIGDYLYYFSTFGTNIRVHKVDPADGSVVYERTFSGWPAPAGQPTEFGGYLYVPSAGGVFKELTTIDDDLTSAILMSGTPPTETSFSLGADTDDDYLRKSSAASYAAARASTSVLYTGSSEDYVGQAFAGGTTWLIFRPYLKFDTSAINDADTVFTAKLRLYLTNDWSDTNFTIQVRSFTWSGGGLTSADWRATPSGDTLIGSFSSADLPAANNWFEIDISTAAISLTGNTEFYLISSRDDDDPGTAPTGNEGITFEAREAAGTNGAQLIVTHGQGLTITDNTAAANASGGSAFTILGDNSDDIFYWGSATKFDGIYFNIVTAANTAIAQDWELWTGAAWVDFPSAETDGTSGFTQSGWVTWDSTAQTGWATTTVNSVTGYFVRVKTATAATTWPTADWTPPSDVWTDGPKTADANRRYAWHFGTAGKLLWRVGDNADPPKHYVINSCATAPLTYGNWTDVADYVIGKPGRNINSIVELGRWAYIGKEEGLFGSDTEGNQTNALDFTRGIIASTNCSDSIRWLGTLVTVHKSGLWNHTGVSSDKIGVETLKGNNSAIKGGRYTALATAGDWLYAAYLVGTTTYLLALRPGDEDEPPYVWYHLYTFASTTINTMWISGLTTNPRLYLGITAAPCSAAYIILAQDGSPDPTDANVTFQAQANDLDLPAVDWGIPGVPKHGHMVEVVTSQAKGTGGTVKVYAGWDGTTPATLLGTITTATKTQCFFAGGNTQGTHWGYRPQIRIQNTGHASNVLRVEKVSLYCAARPRKEPVITAVVRCGDNLDKLRDAKTMYDDLEALENAGVYLVRDPDDPSSGTFYAIVENVDEYKGEQLADYSGERLLSVTLRVIEYV